MDYVVIGSAGFLLIIGYILTRKGVNGVRRRSIRFMILWELKGVTAVVMGSASLFVGVLFVLGSLLVLVDALFGITSRMR